MKAEDLPRIRETIRRWAIMYPIPSNMLGERSVRMAAMLATGVDITVEEAEARMAGNWADSLLIAIEREFREEL